MLPEAADTALLVALVGAPDVYLEQFRFLRLGQAGVAIEVMNSTGTDFLSWSPQSRNPAPVDWQQLVAAAGKSTACCKLYNRWVVLS